MEREEANALVAYWEAANYLTVAQIYLQANPLLREPLRAEHIKPRLLGHWGTSPGLNLVYAQLNRLIRRTEAKVLYVTGPGHGGPAIVANVYLEGTYSEIYPHVSQDEAGLLRLVRQFSTPGGIPKRAPARPEGRAVLADRRLLATRVPARPALERRSGDRGAASGERGGRTPRRAPR